MDVALSRVMFFFYFVSCFNDVGVEKVVGREIRKADFLWAFPQRVQFLNVSQVFV